MPAPDVFDGGALVLLSGLVTRQDLEGQLGTVLSFDDAAARYAVRVHSTNESVRIKAQNLRRSIFSPVPAPG